MRLIDPSYEILTPINGVEILKNIELVARTSTLSYDLITEDSYQKLIPSLLSKGHYSPFEFFNVTVKFTTSRAVLDELRTHRIGSHVMSSTRYCNYSKDRFENEISICCPEYVNKEVAEQSLNNLIYMAPDITWVWACAEAEKKYFQLLELGWKPEQARGVLPLDIASTMMTQFNLRQWREFFKLRTAKATHSEFRRLSIPLLKELQEKIPFVFDDIII